MKMEYPLVRRIREACLTQDGVAQYAGMKRMTLYRKIQGKNEFTVGEMFRICDYLGIETADIPKYFKGA